MNAKPHSPEWLIANADHGIAFEVACASALERLLAENANLQQQLEAIGAGGVGPLMPSKLAQHDIADSGLLGNIESPFNACMHQEHCKRWKKQAGHSPDAGNMVTPDEIDYAHELRRHSRKLCEPVGETAGVMQRAADEIEQLRAMLAAAPQQPVVEQPQGGQEPDWQDLYRKEKRRAEMWIAKYENGIGKLERAVPVSAQPQGEQEPDAFYEWWNMRPSLTRLQAWLLWKDQAKAEGGAA